MYITIKIYVPWHLIFFAAPRVPVCQLHRRRLHRCAAQPLEWKAGLCRGCCFFPLRKCIFFRCGYFLGCKAGLSLLLVFFRVFFLPRTGFFPPRTIFSRCLQNAFFLLQIGAFVLLQGVFSAALNFSRCEAAFFAGVFSRCGNSFFPLQGVFFLLPNVFFSVPMFFSCCEPVFLARCAKTRS